MNNVNLSSMLLAPVDFCWPMSRELWMQATFVYTTHIVMIENQWKRSLSVKYLKTSFTTAATVQTDKIASL